MANKRQKKKQQKKNLQRQAQQSGISQKQLKQLTIQELGQIVTDEEKKRKKKELARERYQKKKSLINSYGLQDIATPRSTFEFIQSFIDKLTPTQDKKRQWLIENKIDFRYKDLKKSWAEIYKMGSKDPLEGRIFTSDWYIYAGYYDKQGEIGILQHQRYYDGMTVEELKNAIVDSLNRRGLNESSGRSGDTIIYEFHKNNMGFMRYQIKHNERKKYQTILSNEFTLHGSLKLTVALLDLSREDLRKHIYETLKSYFKNHFTELYEEWRQ